MATTGSNRLWVIGSVLLVVVIAGLGFLLGINPQLEAAKAADTQREEVEAQNSILEIDLVALKAQFAEIDDYRAQREALRLEIPTTISTAEVLAQLKALGDTHGVVVQNVTTTDAVTFVASEGSVAAELGGDVSNLAYLPVEISIGGSRDAVLAFINGLQTGQSRLYMISDLQFSNDGDLYAAVLTGAVYVLVDPGARLGDAIIAEPAADAAEETPAP